MLRQQSRWSAHPENLLETLQVLVDAWNLIRLGLDLDAFGRMFKTGTSIDLPQVPHAPKTHLL